MKQDRIKEQRLIEATRKDYMGADGKVAVILRNLGTPIMSQGSPLFETTEAIDPYQLDDEGLPYFNEDEGTAKIGMMFDGLSRGIHMEIKQMEYHIEVYYKGYKVFEEYKGDLVCYNPGEWEDQLERLYKVAWPTEKEKRKHKKIVRTAKAEQVKNSWVEEMKKTWGFDL